MRTTTPWSSLVFAPVRTLVSLSLVVAFVWFSFNVNLGRRTLAEHLDRIGDTVEAKELVEGTRSTVNPLLQEATERVFGERVEAPTAIETLEGGWSPPPGKAPKASEATWTRTSSAERSKLPGRSQHQP